MTQQVEQAVEQSDRDSQETGPSARIVVVDDEPRARQALVELLEGDGYEVRQASDGFKALGVVRDWAPDVLLTDWRMPVMDGLTLLKKARKEDGDIACLVMTAFGSVENAVEAMKAGADDYLTKPLNFDAVTLTLERAVSRQKMRRELESLRSAQDDQTEARIVGSSPPIERMLSMIDQVADSRATVLVTGESGTGKELVARRVHDKSSRSDGPFVRLHCAALAESLLESELFGHEKGAFTGATSRRTGRFEEADGGTLFLDEIGEIPQSVQVKLLRFLQQREFERVGGNETLSVDVRVVAATNRELEREVQDGNFREDLYFRLNVIHIEAPPLRARMGDVPVLARHFIAKYAEENDKAIRDISPEAVEVLEQYDWPGNVRELENIIERAVVLASAERIEARHLPDGLAAPDGAVADGLHIPGATLEELERFAILETYEATGGSTSETAEVLDISVRKVQYRLRDYREEGISIE